MQRKQANSGSSQELEQKYIARSRGRKQKRKDFQSFLFFLSELHISLQVARIKEILPTVNCFYHSHLFLSRVWNLSDSSVTSVVCAFKTGGWKNLELLAMGEGRKQNCSLSYKRNKNTTWSTLTSQS